MLKPKPTKRNDDLFIMSDKHDRKNSSDDRSSYNNNTSDSGNKK